MILSLVCLSQDFPCGDPGERLSRGALIKIIVKNIQVYSLSHTVMCMLLAGGRRALRVWTYHGRAKGHR